MYDNNRLVSEIVTAMDCLNKKDYELSSDDIQSVLKYEEIFQSLDPASEIFNLLKPHQTKRDDLLIKAFTSSASLKT